VPMSGPQSGHKRATQREEKATHPDAEVARTWWPADKTYGFWRRRMAPPEISHTVQSGSSPGLAAGT